MPDTGRLAGEYRYLRCGEAADVREWWRVVGDFPADCRVVSERSAAGLQIRVSARMLGGRVTEFDLDWQYGQAPPLQANYRVEQAGVAVERREEGSESLREFVARKPGEKPSLLFPLMRIFTGPLISRLLEQDGEGSVVLPYIGDPGDRERLLLPQVSTRTARVRDPHGTLEIGGQAMACRQCEYLGDQYGPDARFWVDQGEWLLAYSWPQDQGTDWQVSLVRPA